MRKDILGYEGLYQIDGLRIISLNYNHTGKERELKQCKDGGGYLQVVLYKEGKRKQYKVHRLIAEAYIPNPENKPELNHKNGNKTDNRIENLEWVTSSENSQHAYDTGLQKTKHPDLVIHEIFELNNQGKTLTEIANTTGYSKSHVCGILKGKYRKLS